METQNKLRQSITSSSQSKNFFCQCTCQKVGVTIMRVSTGAYLNYSNSVNIGFEYSVFPQKGLSNAHTRSPSYHHLFHYPVTSREKKGSINKICNLVNASKTACVQLQLSFSIQLPH